MRDSIPPMRDIKNFVPETVLAELLNQANLDGIQKIVAGAAIIKDGKILLLKRASTEDFLPDLIELPSGGVESGETLIEGLTREVLEETGLNIVSIDKYVDQFDYTSKSGRKNRQFNFLVTTEDAPIILNPDEHQEFIWSTGEKTILDQMNISSHSRKSVENALRKINGK